MKKNEKSAVILSPKDDRDFVVGSKVDVSASFPKAFQVWQPPVEDQGDTGNCVAQTLANIYETWEHNTGKPHRDWSVGYIYGMSDHYGMMPRNACEIVCKDGDVLRNIWENFSENPKCYNARQAVSELIKTQAVKMAEYVNLGTLPEVKAFIVKYKLPVMMIAKGKHYSAFCSGYHATACYGWNDKNELLYTNSWGTGGAYGDGKGKMTFQKTEELWGIIPMETNKKEFTDIKGHWAEKLINLMAKKGIANGYPDGTFQPNKPVTRAEVTAMFARLYDAMNK